MPLEQLSLAVVGAAHPNKKGPGRGMEILLCGPGDPIRLELEPKNPKDPNAVAVYSERDVQIGYLTAERAPWIGKIIREGREVVAIFQEKAPYGAAIRVAFDGVVPTLPRPKATIASALAGPGDDSGFWPDEIPPDE